MPIWLAIPLIGVLWLLSWISTLDPTGSFEGAYVLGSATAVATSWLALRLLRNSN
jgi:hypothetical protein